MSRSKSRLCAGIVIALVACSEGDPVSVAVPTSDEPMALGLPTMVPEIRQSDLRRVVILVDSGGRTAPPTATEVQGTETPASFLDRATTRVGFDAGSFGDVYAEGWHRYASTSSSIETTLNVDFQSMHMASQVAYAEKTRWFNILSTWDVLQAWAAVFTDRTCGLTANGSSRHSAWNHTPFLWAGPWYPESVMSYAQPASQSPCQYIYSDADPDGNRPTGGIQCVFIIWYDLETGEIVHWERISCSTGDSVLI